MITEKGKPIGPIVDGDSVVFFNFRGDRAIEISRAFEQDEFPYFDRGRRPHILYAGMMQYDGDLLIPRTFLVSPPNLSRTMGETAVGLGIRKQRGSNAVAVAHEVKGSSCPPASAT